MAGSLRVKKALSVAQARVSDLVGAVAVASVREAAAVRAVLPSAHVCLEPAVVEQERDAGHRHAFRIVHALEPPDKAVAKPLKSQTYIDRLVPVLSSVSQVQALRLDSLQLNKVLVSALARAIESGQWSVVELSVTHCTAFGDDAGALLARAVAKNPKLRSLSMKGCSLGLETGKALGAALRATDSALEALDVSDTNIGDKGVAQIASGMQCRNRLRRLDVSNDRLRFASCRALALALHSGEGAALEELRLAGNPKICDASCAELCEALKHNRRLRLLDLRGCRVGNSALVALGVSLASGASILRDLDLSESCAKQVDETSAIALMEGLVGKSAALRTLRISEGALGPGASSALAGVLCSDCSSLRTLDLRGNTAIGDAGGVALFSSGLHCNGGLRHLCVAKCGLGPEAAVALGRALAMGQSTLRRLEVSDNALGDSGGAAIFEALEGNKCLRFLSAGNCGFGSAVAANLARALLSPQTVLQELSLPENDAIGDTGGSIICTALQRNCVLRSLNLGGCRLGAQAGVALGVALGASSCALQEVAVHANCDVGDAAGESLALGLRGNTTLTTLLVPSCALGPRFARALGAALRAGCALEAIDVSFNDFEGGDALVAEGCALRQVTAASCGLDASGAQALARMLQAQDSRLERLVLESNDLGDEGGEAVAQALLSHKSLKFLDLEQCGVGARTAEALGAALAAPSCALEHLELSRNPGIGRAAMAIAKGLRPNTSLRALFLNDCSITADGFITVREAGRFLSELGLAEDEYPVAKTSF